MPLREPQPGEHQKRPASGLRHAHPAELAADGLPPNLIQLQLGHSRVATTDRYLRHIARAELVRDMQSRTSAA